jgi:hypothetical protein
MNEGGPARSAFYLDQSEVFQIGQPSPFRLSRNANIPQPDIRQFDRPTRSILPIQVEEIEREAVGLTVRARQSLKPDPWHLDKMAAPLLDLGRDLSQSDHFAVIRVDAQSL